MRAKRHQNNFLAVSFRLCEWPCPFSVIPSCFLEIRSGFPCTAPCLFALLSTQLTLGKGCELLEGGTTASITWAICWLLQGSPTTPLSQVDSPHWSAGLWLTAGALSFSCSFSLSGLSKFWLMCFSPISSCLSVKLSSETAQRQKSRGCMQSGLYFLEKWSDKGEAGNANF